MKRQIKQRIKKRAVDLISVVFVQFLFGTRINFQTEKHVLSKMQKIQSQKSQKRKRVR
jgi:hypothetical protein